MHRYGGKSAHELRRKCARGIRSEQAHDISRNGVPQRRHAALGVVEDTRAALAHAGPRDLLQS